MPGFNIGGGADRDPSNRPEINRAHRWRIISLGENLINSDELVFAKTLQLPSFAVEEEMVTSAAIRYKFAKTINWEDVTVQFYDSIGLFTELEKWRSLVWTADSGIRTASEYKKQSTFGLTYGDGTIIQTFVLHGSWPKMITHSALSYESSDFKYIDLVLSYDFASFESL